ncbi:MAG: PIN domain-containing protein [Firmicutes bacterium]|nr:PIN domain-containing protein [Bacillota bacterium]
MRKIPVLDANIILRFLTNDNPQKAEACSALLEKVERNEEQVWLPDLVLADVIWTLEKFYRQSKAEIADLLTPIMNLRGLHCSGKEAVFLALRLYVRYNIDWTDAFVAAQLISQEAGTIYSYDRDFDRIPDVVRVEP